MDFLKLIDKCILSDKKEGEQRPFSCRWMKHIPGSHMQALTIYKLGLNQNNYSLILISLINIVEW